MGQKPCSQSLCGGSRPNPENRGQSSVRLSRKTQESLEHRYRTGRTCEKVESYRLPGNTMHFLPEGFWRTAPKRMKHGFDVVEFKPHSGGHQAITWPLNSIS